MDDRGSHSGGAESLRPTARSLTGSGPSWPSTAAAAGSPVGAACHLEWIRTVLGVLAAGRDLPGPPPDAPGPFALSDPDRVRDLLASAGWSDVAFADVTEQMYFGATADEAVALVSGLMARLLEGLDDDARKRGSRRAACVDAGAHRTEGVSYASAAWIITARR